LEEVESCSNSALVFAGPPQTWLVFADALAVLGIALTNLGIHEFSTERVVHEMQVVPPQRDLARPRYEAA